MRYINLHLHYITCLSDPSQNGKAPLPFRSRLKEKLAGESPWYGWPVTPFRGRKVFGTGRPTNFKLGICYTDGVRWLASPTVPCTTGRKACHKLYTGRGSEISRPYPHTSWSWNVSTGHLRFKIRVMSGCRYRLSCLQKFPSYRSDMHCAEIHTQKDGDIDIATRHRA